METCAKCGVAFVPEGREDRSSAAGALDPLADVGRVLYGVDPGAALCPTCRRELELTGAALISGEG